MIHIFGRKYLFAIGANRYHNNIEKEIKLATYENPVVMPNNGMFGNDGMGFILGLLFGRGGLGGFGNGADAATISANSAAFEGIREQVAGIAAQLNANQSAAQSAAVQASISSMKDLFVQLDKDNTIRDCQATASILSAICECCCKTQAAIAETKFAVATESCATRQLIAEKAADQALAQCKTDNLILQESCATRTQAAQIASDAAMRDFQNTTTLLNAIKDGNAAIQATLTQTRLDVLKDDNDRIRAELIQLKTVSDIVAKCCPCPTTGNGNGNGNS